MAATWEKLAYVLDTFQKELTLLAKTTDYTVTTSDFEKCLSMNSTGIASFTLPNVDASYVGRRIRFYNLSNYQLSIIPYTGGSIDGEELVKTSIIYSFIEVTVVGANSWHVSSVGNLFSESESFGTWKSSIKPYSGYSYVREITIDNTKVQGSSDLSNFPMLFNSTLDYLKTTGNGGYVTNSNGYDIIFTDENNTQLDHEIEYYSGASGQFIAWVRIPILKYNEDTIIRIHYGNSSVSSSQEDVAGTWNSNYTGIYHLKESTGSRVDSTGNFNGTAYGVTQGGGKIGYSQFFDGGTDYIDFANGIVQGNSDITISFWMYWDTGGADWERIFDFGSSTSVYMFFTPENSTTNVPRFAITTGSGEQTLSGNADLSFDEWHFIAITIDSSESEGRLYIDDELVDTNSSMTLDPSDLGNTINNWLGRSQFVADAYFGGYIDEFHISDTPRTQDWLFTERENQNSPLTFYSIGEA